MKTWLFSLLLTTVSFTSAMAHAHGDHEGEGLVAAHDELMEHGVVFDYDPGKNRYFVVQPDGNKFYLENPYLETIGRIVLEFSGEHPPEPWQPEPRLSFIKLMAKWSGKIITLPFRLAIDSTVQSAQWVWDFKDEKTRWRRFMGILEFVVRMGPTLSATYLAVEYIEHQLGAPPAFGCAAIFAAFVMTAQQQRFLKTTLWKRKSGVPFLRRARFTGANLTSTILFGHSMSRVFDDQNPAQPMDRSFVHANLRDDDNPAHALALDSAFWPLPFQQRDQHTCGPKCGPKGFVGGLPDIVGLKAPPFTRLALDPKLSEWDRFYHMRFHETFLQKQLDTTRAKLEKYMDELPRERNIEYAWLRWRYIRYAMAVDGFVVQQRFTQRKFSTKTPPTDREREALDKMANQLQKIFMELGRLLKLKDRLDRNALHELTERIKSLHKDLKAFNACGRALNAATSTPEAPLEDVDDGPIDEELERVFRTPTSETEIRPGPDAAQ